MNWKAIAIISASAVIGLAALVGLAVVNRPPSTLEKEIIKQSLKEQAVQTMVGACTIAGGNDAKFGPVLMQSQGQVCMQVFGEDIVKMLDGTGSCKLEDKRCLFTVAFALTRFRALRQLPENYEQVQALQEEIDTMYEKLNATKEKQ